MRKEEFGLMMYASAIISAVLIYLMYVILSQQANWGKDAQASFAIIVMVGYPLLIIIIANGIQWMLKRLRKMI